MSVQVIDADRLASQGQTKLEDYYAEVPGLSYVKSAMSSAITLRGIGTEAGTGVRPTAGMTVDDVPYGSATNTGVILDLDPSDVKQIEVLRGPQGTLYGVSSMGGLIKYTMVDPDTSYSFGRFEVDGSDAEHSGSGYGVRGSGNYAISDNLAVRASGFERQDPWYVSNLSDGKENRNEVYGGRVAGLWRISDNVTFKLSALVQHNDQDQSSTVDTDYNLKPIYGKYVHDRLMGSDQFQGSTKFVTGNLSADLGWGQLDSISGYSQHRSTAIQDTSYTSLGAYASIFSNALGLGYSDPGTVIDNRYDVDKYSQEIRLSSEAGSRLSWQLGGFYTKEDTDSVQNFYLADGATGDQYTDYALLISEGSDKYEEEAGFATLGYQFTDRFDVQVGGRYAHYKMSSVGTAGGLVYDDATTYDSNSDDVGTYSLTSRYKFTPDMMSYLRIASGYRAGGSNGNLIDGIPESYKSDSLVSYETGFKGRMLDNTLSVDTALYYIDWTDLQLSQEDLTYGSSYTTNAGKAASQGVELSATYVPNGDWRFVVNYAYTDATLKQDIPGYVEGSTAYGKDGDRLPYSAKNSGAVTATRYFPVGQAALYTGVTVAYVGDRDMEFTQSESLPRIHLPSYTTVALNAELDVSEWTMNFYVRNLTDKYGFINANRRGSSDTTGGTDVTYGATIIQPRTVGLSLSRSF